MPRSVRQRMRAASIINEFDIAKKLRGQPGVKFCYVYYYSGAGERFSIDTGWHLTAPGWAINPVVPGKHRPWWAKENTSDLITAFARLSDKDEALAMATKRTGITDWIPSPCGRNAWVSKAHIDLLLTLLT